MREAQGRSTDLGRVAGTVSVMADLADLIDDPKFSALVDAAVDEVAQHHMVISRAGVMSLLARQIGQVANADRRDVLEVLEALTLLDARALIVQLVPAAQMAGAHERIDERLVMIERRFGHQLLSNLANASRFAAIFADQMPNASLHNVAADAMLAINEALAGTGTADDAPVPSQVGVCAHPLRLAARTFLTVAAGMLSDGWQLETDDAAATEQINTVLFGRFISATRTLADIVDDDHMRTLAGGLER